MTNQGSVKFSKKRLLYYQGIFLFMVSSFQILSAQNIESEGLIRSESLQLTNGAGDGKILMSDDSGNASWSELPSRKRTIVITPGMLRNDFFPGGLLSKIDTSNHSCVILPESTTSGYTVSLPLPADFSSTTATVRILYSSTTNAGNFRLEAGLGGLDLSGDLNKSLSTLTRIVSSPAESDDLQQYSFNVNLGPENLIVNLVIVRIPENTLDTSTGDLKIVGICIDYFD